MGINPQRGTMRNGQKIMRGVMGRRGVTGLH